MSKKLIISGRYVRIDYLEVSADEAQEAIESGVNEETFQEECDTIGGVVSGWIQVDDEEVGAISVPTEALQNASVIKLKSNNLVNEEHGKFVSEEIYLSDEYDPSKLTYDVERLEFDGEMYEVFTIYYDENEVEHAWSDSQYTELRVICENGSQHEIEFQDEDEDDD